ncbi:AAA family ATPase [Pseudomonas fortuita]|uniref:AAA family ATPase n=2 Tax=Pseudomonas fortuita TaxID=3233375 RepID=A0ACD4P8J9_9PSED|nr:AAA family ATPase [Pseudomonas putida]
MSTTLTFDRLFVSSEIHDACFYSEFSPGANIISGRNTSGKSSLIQSLLYTFGVNDLKENLSEILNCQPTFRVDFSKTTEDQKEKYSIIRTQGSIYVK